MNFFAHFLVDRIHQKSNYNAALIAPDLFRHFLRENNRFNWLHLKNEPEIIASNLHVFCEGGLQHIQRDKQFHQSPLFDNIYHKHRIDWINLAKNHGLERWWFSLHVSVELIIDKILINNHLNELFEFYNTLVLERDSYINLLQYLNHEEIDTFKNRFDKFLESQYLFHFREFTGIAYALHRIHGSLKISTPWHPNDVSVITAALQRVETSIIENTNNIGLLATLQATS